MIGAIQRKEEVGEFFFLLKLEGAMGVGWWCLVTRHHDCFMTFLTQTLFVHVWDKNRLSPFVCFFDKVIMHIHFIHAGCLGACG